MVPAGNKAKRLSLVNHTAKTIHHHHYHHHHHAKIVKAFKPLTVFAESSVFGV